MGKKRRDDFSEPISDQHPAIPRYSFCGNREQFGDGTALLIQSNKRPTWWVDGDLPSVSRSDFEAVIQAAFDAWGEHLDVKGDKARSKSSATLLVITKRMDGSGGVLADCELPRGDGRQQQMRFDTSERLVIQQNAPRGYLDLQAIANHELGHFWGYQHWPVGAPAELMEPSIQDGLRYPQPTEITWGVRMFGAAEKPVEPGPGSDEIELEISVKSLGKTVKFTGKKKW